MKLKNKLAFVAMVSIIDLIVVIFVITNNGKTNIKNDISNKTAANIVDVTPIDNNEIIEENKEEVIEQLEETSENTEIEEQLEETSENTEIEEQLEETSENTEIEEQINIDNNISYDEMTLEQKIESLNSGTLSLVYADTYTTSNERLTKSKGVVYYNDHRETYYDEKVLPGSGLSIPGRHVADDGTIRDEDGYICVAANQEYMAKGTILITSLGPAKVYDTGCAYGTIDIYVNW